MTTEEIGIGSVIKIDVEGFTYCRDQRPPRFIKVVEIAPDNTMLCEYKDGQYAPWQKYRCLHRSRVRSYITTGIASIVDDPVVEDEDLKPSMKDVAESLGISEQEAWALGVELLGVVARRLKEVRSGSQ